MKHMISVSFHKQPYHLRLKSRLTLHKVNGSLWVITMNMLVNPYSNCNSIQVQPIITPKKLIQLYSNQQMKRSIGLLCILLITQASADRVQRATPKEVYAIAAGFPVSYSCVYQHNQCWLPELDSDGAWCACANHINQWIRISSLNLENWVGVITQGRSKHDQRVEEFYITYTTDGISWQMLDGGRVFKGNNDTNTKIRNDFASPVQARAIRLHPIKWNSHISIRFEGIFSVKTD